MGKTWLFGLLTLPIALGLIGLLAYTSESVHEVAAPGPAITELARPCGMGTIAIPRQSPGGGPGSMGLQMSKSHGLWGGLGRQ